MHKIAQTRIDGIHAQSYCQCLPQPALLPPPTLQVWQRVVQGLTGLQSLELHMHGWPQEGDGMSLCGLARLRVLHLAGCFSLHLALSVMRLTGVCMCVCVHGVHVCHAPCMRA